MSFGDEILGKGDLRVVTRLEEEVFEWVRIVSFRVLSGFVSGVIG